MSQETSSSLSPSERQFAKQVRTLREERGWSQSDLATLLQGAELGHVNQTTVSRIENGTRQVRMTEALAIARTFDVPIETMMDPSEVAEATVFYKRRERRARQAYVRFREALAQVAEQQLVIQDDLERFMTIASTPPDDEATRREVLSLARNMESFTKIDLAAEAEEFVSEIGRRRSGEADSAASRFLNARNAFVDPEKL